MGPEDRRALSISQKCSRPHLLGAMQDPKGTDRLTAPKDHEVQWERLGTASLGRSAQKIVSENNETLVTREADLYVVRALNIQG